MPDPDRWDRYRQPEPDPSTLTPCPCRKPRECSNAWLERGRYCQLDTAGVEGETW